jgi:hypothetical protein
MAFADLKSMSACSISVACFSEIPRALVERPRFKRTVNNVDNDNTKVCAKNDDSSSDDDYVFGLTEAKVNNVKKGVYTLVFALERFASHFKLLNVFSSITFMLDPVSINISTSESLR